MTPPERSGLLPEAPSAEEHLPRLVIVGRPNVGKSTLFNRITKSRRAIVGDEPGITRDRIQMTATFQGKTFEVIDTGGMTVGDEREFPVLTNVQVRVALEEADHVVMVVDGRSELTVEDREIGDYLRRYKLPVTVAVNKCDTDRLEDLTAGFYELGFERVKPISAEHGRGIQDLLTAATGDFDDLEPTERADPTRPIQIAIIGRPNAGKSTLLNRLSGKQRSIVSATPGTTRDAVNEIIEHEGQRYELIDTAGIRRKGKTTAMAEKLSVVMAQRHLRMADVAFLMFDASEGVTALDATIAGYAHEEGRAVILLANKWDDADGKDRNEFTLDVRDKLKFLDYAPIVTISALTGSRVNRIFPLVDRVFANWNRRISTGELNRFVEGVPFHKAKVPGPAQPKVYYMTQPRTRPPAFALFSNQKGKLHFSFERFLVNRLRERFDFEGAPILIKSRHRGQSGAANK